MFCSRGSYGLTSGAASAVPPSAPSTRSASTVDGARTAAGARGLAPGPRPLRASAPADAHVYRIRGSSQAYGHVDQEVDERVRQGDEQHDPLDQQVVLEQDGVDREPPDARAREDRLDHDGAAEQPPELEARQRQHGQEGVPEAVAQDDRRRPQPLRAGGGHVVLAQHLQHARSRQARHERRAVVAQRDGGQDQPLPLRAARDGQPAEGHREDQDQDEPRPEDRDRQAAEREEHAQPVHPRVVEHGRQEPEAHADQDRDRHGRHGEPHRVGQHLEDRDQHRPVRVVGASEVPVQRVPQRSGRTGRGTARRGRARAAPARPSPGRRRPGPARP